MSNTSATGGYLLPSATRPLPNSLNLNQFIQTVLVGLSGIAGDLIRPKFQVAPPKQPTIETNWVAFQIVSITPDANGYTGMQPNNSTIYSRNEEIEVQCSFYGPLAYDYADQVRDGFQIQQNLEALRLANMGFKETSGSTLVPDLVNDRWIQRVELSIILRRQVQRVYPILSFINSSGTIHTVLGTKEYLLNWVTPEGT